MWAVPITGVLEAVGYSLRLLMLNRPAFGTYVAMEARRPAGACAAARPAARPAGPHTRCLHVSQGVGEAGATRLSAHIHEPQTRLCACPHGGHRVCVLRGPPAHAALLSLLQPQRQHPGAQAFLIVPPVILALADYMVRPTTLAAACTWGALRGRLHGGAWGAGLTLGACPAVRGQDCGAPGPQQGAQHPPQLGGWGGQRAACARVWRRVAWRRGACRRACLAAKLRLRGAWPRCTARAGQGSTPGDTPRALAQVAIIFFASDITCLFIQGTGASRIPTCPGRAPAPAPSMAGARLIGWHQQPTTPADFVLAPRQGMPIERTSSHMRR